MPATEIFEEDDEEDVEEEGGGKTTSAPGDHAIVLSSRAASSRVVLGSGQHSGRSGSGGRTSGNSWCSSVASSHGERAQRRASNHSSATKFLAGGVLDLVTFSDPDSSSGSNEPEEHQDGHQSRHQGEGVRQIVHQSAGQSCKAQFPQHAEQHQTKLRRKLTPMVSLSPFSAAASGGS